MKLDDVKPTLADYNISVNIRSTPDLFPRAEVGANHFSVVCETLESQERVHHWIEFMRPLFVDFDAWAVYMDAIVEK